MQNLSQIVEKLQQLHNCYFITLKDFNSFNDTFKTNLLPNLLGWYQNIQEIILKE